MISGEKKKRDRGVEEGGLREGGEGGGEKGRREGREGGGERRERGGRPSPPCASGYIPEDVDLANASPRLQRLRNQIQLSKSTSLKISKQSKNQNLAGSPH